MASVGSLEPLQNPLTRVGANRLQGVNWKHDLVTNSCDWDEAAQYYVNDLVFSPLNGGAYVMRGGDTAPFATVVRGGDDPSLAPGMWEALAPYGVSAYESNTPAVTAGGAGLYVVAATGSVSVPPESVWQVTWQGTATGGTGAGGVMTAADIATWTVTATGGAGATVAVLTKNPTVGVASHSWGMTAVVVAGATGTPTVTLTGAYAGTVQAITVPRLTLVRLA